METLVDIDGFVEPKDYASSTFYGSGVETNWSGFDSFYQEYLRIRRTLAEQLPQNKEYDFPTMFKLICESNNSIEQDKVEYIANQLFANYWRNYTAKCFVGSNVGEILNLLHKKYRLGVVSNFKVDSGIEALLEHNKINHHFDFIITSMSIGWRKPDRRIYQAVLDKTNIPPGQHLFIGDDFENDFQHPAGIGMKTLLLDKNAIYPGVDNRITSLSDLEYYL